jgi:hypothetical protein
LNDPFLDPFADPLYDTDPSSLLCSLLVLTGLPFLEELWLKPVVLKPVVDELTSSWLCPVRPSAISESAARPCKDVAHAEAPM